MAIRIRTKRLATSATNPRRVSRRPRSKNPKKRKMSDKQIRHFGTKAQKAAAKPGEAPGTLCFVNFSPVDEKNGNSPKEIAKR